LLFSGSDQRDQQGMDQYFESQNEPVAKPDELANGVGRTGSFFT
jgi:hypothetical protein